MEEEQLTLKKMLLSVLTSMLSSRAVSPCACPQRPPQWNRPLWTAQFPFSFLCFIIPITLLCVQYIQSFCSPFLMPLIFIFTIQIRICKYHCSLREGTCDWCIEYLNIYYQSYKDMLYVYIPMLVLFPLKKTSKEPILKYNNLP